MKADMEAALNEYLAPIQLNNSITNEHKKAAEDAVRGFVDFLEAKQDAIDNPQPEVEKPAEPKEQFSQPIDSEYVEPQGANA